MTRAQLLAALAAACGVAGAWEVLAAVERAWAVAWLGAAVRPLTSSRSEGREASVPERRRLAVLASGVLLVGGGCWPGPWSPCPQRSPGRR